MAHRTDQHTNLILKTFLEGLYDEHCVISKLRGCPHILKQIWTNVKTFWEDSVYHPYQNEADFGFIHLEERPEDSSESWTFFSPIAVGDERCSFPEPSDININMMPFLVGESFEACRLPDYLKPYWPMIEACLSPEITRAYHHIWPVSTLGSDLGKVYYLTVQESHVEAGQSQRRPGLHVDRPGQLRIRPEPAWDLRRGRGCNHSYIGHGWGHGCAHRAASDLNDYAFEKERLLMYGGIYVASSVSNSSKVWNCGVAEKVIGRLGDIEHMRSVLPSDGEVLQPHQLYWMTDITPHESLPLEISSYRQFFRLVSSQVSLWYRDHSTPNPLGVQPDPALTKVVAGDKFSQEGVQVVEVVEG